MAEAVATKKTTKKVAKEAAPEVATKAVKTAPKASSGQFAVISTGGKQYLVKPGQLLKIEKLPGDHKEGEKITFTEVLLSGDTVGAPTIAGAYVSAVLKKIGRYPTVDVVKYKQKSRYFKKNGHRQPYFEVQIVSIK